MLRHAFATHEIAGGRDLSVVAEAMGHANTLMVSTTYQHAIAERKQASEPLRVEEAALAAAGEGRGRSPGALDLGEGGRHRPELTLARRRPRSRTGGGQSRFASISHFAPTRTAGR